MRLRNAPVVEAILDIDCNMRPDFDLEEAANVAADSLTKSYPGRRIRHFTEHAIKQERATDPQVSTRGGIDAFQFFSDDGKQLVQFRQQGFSFNRLTPYTSLDEYLDEIGRAWVIYTDFVRPLTVRAIRLRYINRINLPLESGGVELDNYLKLGPRTPARGGRLTLSNFMSRNGIIDRETGHQATIILASQPIEKSKLPVIFDITSADESPPNSLEWDDIEPRLQSLRELKNSLFEETLTNACLELFR